MSIQLRRGSDYDFKRFAPSNIMPGEPAVALDTESLYIGLEDGRYFSVGRQDEIDGIADRMGLQVIKSDAYTPNYCATVLENNDIGLVQSSSYRMVQIACEPGDWFTVSGVTSAEVPLWIFASDDNQVIEYSQSIGTTHNFALDAPPNTAWILINLPIDGDYVNYYGRWNKTLKEQVDKAKIYKGSCTTGRGIAAKAVTINGEAPPLAEGDLLLVSFSQGNSTDNMTLSINGGTATGIGYYIDGSLEHLLPLNSSQTVLFRYMDRVFWDDIWEVIAVSPSVEPIPDRAIETDSKGAMIISEITTDELHALQGVESNIQEQIDDVKSDLSQIMVYFDAEGYLCFQSLAE